MNIINPLSDTETNKNIKILVVEDDYNLALNLQEILESLAYRVIGIAHSAEVAIEKAYQLHPNLILMDIHLSGEMDGIQAAAEIWNNLQIPVIYVTGYADQNTLDRAKTTCHFAYILKPFTNKELSVAIQTALNRYELEKFSSSLIQAVSEGLILVDSQLRVKYINSVAEKLTGWCMNEVKGQILTEVIQFIDRETQLSASKLIMSALQKQTTIYLGESIPVIARDGKTILIADSISPLQNNNGVITGYLLMIFGDKAQRSSTTI